MRIFNAKVVGNYLDNAWLGVEWVAVGDGGIGVVVEVQGKDEQVRLEVVGRVVLEELLGGLKGVFGSETREGLESVVEVVVGENSEVRTLVMLVVLRGGKARVVGNGGSEVCLWRGGKLGRLLEPKMKLDYVGGVLKEGDVLVLGTSGLFESLNEVWSGLEGEGERGEGLVNKVAEKLVVWVGIKQRLNVAGLVLGVGGGDESKGVLSSGKVSGNWKGRLKRLMPGWGGVVVRRGMESKRKKWLRWVLVLVLGLIMVSVGWGWRWQKEKKTKEEIEMALAPVVEMYERAEADLEVNPLRARAVLVEARGVLEEKLAEYEEGGVEYEEIKSWWDRVEEKYKEVSGEVGINPGVYLDMGLVKEGFFGSVMALVGEWVVVVDTNNGSILRVGVVNKQAELVVENGDFGQVKKAAGTEEKGYLLADDGVWGVDMESGGVDKEIEPEGLWQGVVGLGVYGENVYVLDKDQGELWRYKPVGEEWLRQRWLAPGINPDFSNVVDMFIDGSIWVLGGDGEVRQYLQGASTGFGVSGLPDGGVQACCLGVSGEGGGLKVYVLDRQGKRVVEYGAGGDFLRQFRWEGMGVVSDVVVADGKMLLLSGEKIMEVRVGG